MTTLREIRGRLDAIRTEMRSILAAPAGAGGDLSAEQTARFDAVRAESDTLAANEARVAALDELERRSAGQPVGSTGDNRLDAEIARVGILDVVRAGMGGTDAASGRAREVSAELERRSGRKAQGLLWHMGAPEQRTLTTALPAGSPGSNIIGTDFRPDLFIDRLRAGTVVRKVGATVLTGLQGNVAIPRRKASVVAGWVAENSALSLADPQFESVMLTPRHAGVISEWSRNMILQASPDVEQLARNDMALVLGETLDAAAIAGTGSGNMPRGILSTTGIGSVAMGTNGAALTYDAVADLIGQVADANAETGALAFVSNTRVRRSVQKIKDTQGRPLGESVVWQGLPTAFNNLIPANLNKGTGTNLSALLFANWSDLLIGVWSELDIMPNAWGDAYSRGGVQIRAMMTVDIAVRHPESFAAITDIVA